MSVSSNGRLLACLYSCGTIIIWTLPQLSIHKIWYLEELTDKLNVSKQESTAPQAENVIDNILLDLNWCLDLELAVLLKNGSLVVSGIDEFNNRLAQINPKFRAVDHRPEKLDVCAKLANLCDINAGFLLLNCKHREFSSWRRESESAEAYEDIRPEENSAVDLPDNHSLMRQILKFFVHFEMFNQQKKHLYVERTYSLLVLKKITATELYVQKINNEEYEEALDFARLFGLDENRVYKTQWNNTSPVTEDSIENFLKKITDKAWILRECCERIPESFSAAEALLDYGLKSTDFASFLNCDNIFETEDIDPLIDSKYEAIIDEAASSFSKTQLQIMQLRKQLLLYWDALTVYKEIMESDPRTKAFDGETFKNIRNEPPLYVVLHFARDGNAKAVAVLFQYYGEILSPFWFRILDNFPESTPPSNYKELLPRFNEHNKLETWQTKCIREADWSESGQFKELITLKSNFEETACVAFPFSMRVAAEWYESKIRKIVERSGLVDFALELVNLAIKNNITGLEYLKHNLLILDTLMYELLIDNEMSLNEIEKMTYFDQLMLLMSNTITEESFLENVSNVLLPFLSRCENLRPHSRDVLLNDYLKHLSKYDLNMPLTFFVYVSEKHEQEVFFSDKRMLELGLLSVYACQRVDQIDVAMKIIQHLPECSDNNNSDYEEVFNLHSQLTELQLELDVMQLLQSYDIEKCVGYLHEHKNDAQFQKNTLAAMVNANVNKRMLTREAVRYLLDDMIFIENFFSTLPSQTYLRIFAHTMLTVSRSDCIEDFAPLALTCSPTKSSLKMPIVLPYDESVAIVVEAAQYYFNDAASFNDPNISLAQICLSLIDSHADVEREKKLINVLKELYDLGVQISPLKVRMSVNNMKIIEKVLKTKPKAYKNVDRLISLAQNLKIDNSAGDMSLELEVLNCAVDAAFQAKDYGWCSSIVSKLMDDQKPCWRICKKLCECEAYDDLDAKQKLIKLALIGCSDKELVIMVELRNNIERKVLEKRLQNSIQKLQNSDEEQQPGTSEENVAPKPATERKLSTRQFPEFDKLHEFMSIPSFVNMLHSSSSNVLGSGISLWKNAFTLSPKDDIGEVDSNLNADCTKLGFPEFYKNVHEQCKCICFLDKKTSDNETQILQLLLRYHLLSQGKSDDVSNAITTNIDDVIAQLFARTFPGDCLLGLCLLLLLHDDLTYAENIFDSLPTTLSVEKFALFYYCLKFLSSNKEPTDSWLQNIPSELVTESETLARSSNSTYVKVINKYQNLISKRKNVIQLEDLGCGIDSVRFFSDETYKTDSILGLAMYEEREKLDLALSMGAEYGVAAEDVVLSHISSLFLSHNVAILTERLKEPIVLDTLKRKPKYAAERIINDIYGGLYGCDYQILILYYALLNQVAENDAMHFAKPRDHMKLLRKLKTFSKTIDYKLLTAQPPKIVDAIFPSLLTNEVNNALNFLISLPSSLIESISLQNIFETLLQKSLKSKVSNDTIEKLKNYLKRFTRIEKFNEACLELEIEDQYLKELQTALKLNDNTELKRIASVLVLDSSMSTDVLRIVLEFVPTTSLTDLITDLLKKELDSEKMKVLIHRIENCLEDNEYEKCWRDSLTLFLTKAKISETVQLNVKKILSILERSDDEIYSIIEMLHETRLILREWVTIHSRITIFDVATVTSRLHLIKELVRKSSSVVQLSLLAKLLTFWPAFAEPTCWDDDPWLLLVEKLLCRSENTVAHDDEVKLVQIILVKRKFAEDMRRDFFKYVESTNCNRVLLVCFCVLSKDETLIQSVNRDIADFRQAKRLPKMIEECINRMQLS